METTRKDLIVRNTILIGGGLFVIAMSYGSGMRAQKRQVESINETRKLAQQNYRDAQRKLRVRLAATEQLEARRQVALAMQQLDLRNFGAAGEHIQTAAQLLQQAQTANTTNPDLENAMKALQQINPVATVNVGGEREKLQAVATEIDKALDDYTPTLIRDSEADDKAHPIVPPTMNDVPLPPGNHIKD